MDLELLQSKILKNPSNYKEEFTKILQTYEHLSKLPTQPYKQTHSHISFLSSLAPFYPSSTPLFIQILQTHLETTKDEKLKKEILRIQFLLKRRKLVSQKQLLVNIFNHCTDFNGTLRRCTGELKGGVDEDVKGLLVDYAKNGSDRQGCFAMFMIVSCYELGGDKILEDVICEYLLDESKMGNICMLYFLDEIEFKNEDNQNEDSNEKNNGESEKGVSKIVKNISKEAAIKISEKVLWSLKKKEERKKRLNKLKLIAVLKEEHDLKTKIFHILIKMMDPSKEDLKEVMKILVSSLSEDEVDDAVKKIVDVFCSDYKDDDVVVYGLNVLKEICVRFPVGEFVLEMVDVFKKSKCKSILYAYTLLYKSVHNKKGGKNAEDVEQRDLTYVKRRRTKKEKVEAARAGKKKKKAWKRKYD